VSIDGESRVADARAGAGGLQLKIVLAELQLKIVWEEILKRFDTIEVVGPPKRVYSGFAKGYETLPVRIPG